MEHTVEGVKIDNATGMPVVSQRLRWKVRVNTDGDLKVCLQKRIMFFWHTVLDGYPNTYYRSMLWEIFTSEKSEVVGRDEITLGAVMVYKKYAKKVSPTPGREFVGVYPPKSL